MRMKYRLLAAVAACSLTFAGCSKVDNTPPPGTTTDTPVLDIDTGTEVPADEVGKTTDAPTGGPAAPDEPGK